jgi:hypothetical protein
MKKLFLLFLFCCCYGYSQQISDPDFNPSIKNPAYETGKGSHIYIDESHYNFHTMDGRYKPFADLLIKDGYVVSPLKDSIDTSIPDDADILVISNSLNKLSTENWVQPTQSAFTQDEINNIADWVNKGGSLFLIADHMPFAGAAANLAARFGFTLSDGFAFDTTKSGPDLFTKENGTLHTSFITEGRNKYETVDSIYSFTGEAIQIPEDAVPVLVLNSNFISLMPDTAWSFNKDTPKIPASGKSQGAVKKFGKGHVAVWGEAAMFSAQLAGENKLKVGMNYPESKHNYQLLLNIIHWLDSLY